MADGVDGARGASGARVVSAFEALDEKPLERFHLMAMLTTGMGVFTDGYDLSSVGLVLPLVLASFGIHKISGLDSGLLAGSALVGSALGAVLFGALAQKGRKRFYGVDVALMAVAAAAQAFAPSLRAIIAIRFVLGIGVGADYVLSPTIMAEHANRRDRGKTMGFGFGVMWDSGALSAGLILLALHSWGVPADLEWRIILGLGTLPALSVLSLRRKMPETARFLARIGGQSDEAREVIAEISGGPTEVTASAPVADRRTWQEVLRRHGRVILGAAVLWMVYDIVTYSAVLFGPSVIAAGIGTTAAIFTLVVYGAFNVPSGLTGAMLIDRIGRKKLMAGGFALAGVALFAFAPHMGHAAPLVGFLLFGAYAVSMRGGPGTVSGSGVLGVELAPTRVRSIAQSITVVGGRVGAAIAAFVFPALLAVISRESLMITLGVVAVAGAVLTFLLVPETSGRSLEEINDDTDAAITAIAAGTASAGARLNSS